MRLKNKDLSLIPEFRISDHISKYLNNSNGWLTTNSSQFSIFGVNENNTQTVLYTTTTAGGQAFSYSTQISENTPQNSSENEFYRIYSFSDFMEHFEIINDKHEDFVGDEFPKTLTLSCKALMKFIPYDGFYPAERTLEIAEKFRDIYEPAIEGSEAFSGDDQDLKMRPIMAPLFSPGILYNTIKSGIAVDYPIYTSSYDPIHYYNNSGNATPPAPEDFSDYYAIGTASVDIGRWHFRVPFESILEPESLNGLPMQDMEPHPSCSLNGLYSKINTTDKSTNEYKLAINNFLGETIKFFLKDGELTTIQSRQENYFKTVNSAVSYAMRIKIRRSMTGIKRETSEWATPQEYFSTEITKNINTDNNIFTDYRMATLNMYSRPTAFGPPVAGTGSFDDDATVPGGNSMNNPNFLGRTTTGICISGVPTTWDFTPPRVNDGLYGYNVSHTPPYYSGESWIDIIYTPTAGGKPTIDDIQANSKIVCWRIDGFDPLAWSSGDIDAAAFPMHSSSVNEYAMQLTSSINIFNKLFVESATDETQKNPSWAIQTKFETPILNFGPFGEANYSDTRGNHYLDNITLPTTSSAPWEGYGGQTTTPIGMWHQFGSIPSGDQGVYLEVGPIPTPWLNTRATKGDISTIYASIDQDQSLSEITGFTGKINKKSKTIGKLADSKTVYEAVVAVPFIERVHLAATSRKITDKNIGNSLFFELPTIASFGPDTKIENRDPKGLFPSGTSQDILNMADMVWKKYVFPPQFDFIRNPSAKPVAMYVFEFDHTFDKNDLSYIWQNIAPKFGTQFKEATATISHKLLGKEMLDEMKDKVKWMVFKVKQRAETSYYNNLLTRPPEDTNSEINYGYNWPYDYFSMVEFAKINATVSYGTDPFEPLASGVPTTSISSPTSQGSLPPLAGQDKGNTNNTSTKNTRQAKTQEQIGVSIAAKIKLEDKKK